MKKKQAAFILLGALAAGVTAYLLLKNKGYSSGRKPPKAAPQLDIDNPGSQHEFPKPPAESEMG